MNEHAAFCLSGNYEHYTQQVRRQSRPGSIGNSHDRTIYERLYLICFLCRNIDIVSPLFQFDAQTAETFRDDAQVFIRNILDGELTLRHGCHTDKTADFDHIGKYRMFGTVQFVHSFNGQQIGGNALYLGAHAVQHLAKLLQIRFAGSIVNSGCSFGQYRCHHDVGSSGYRSFVQQHVGAFQFAS